MGIRSAMVNRYNLGGEGLNHVNGLSAGIKELRTSFSEVNEFASTSGMRIVSGVCTPHCILNPDDYPNIGFGSCSEDVYRRPLTFDIEGNLRLCNHSPIVAGNIFKQSFGEIFSSRYIDEWSELNMSFCNQCTRLSKCRGGCRAASEQMGLTLKTEDPIVHELNTVPFA
ncbi:SPASM domain-containing protein [Bacteroides sp. 51]|uniref:SPASM domain-containing protein n=1 Tax=Bacteroides sp. 51 TaxID=2302938 RepID=UPI0013D6E91D|nr:SPASM domain-containing protein [Bacteroides sp. 51]